MCQRAHRTNPLQTAIQSTHSTCNPALQIQSTLFEFPVSGMCSLTAQSPKTGAGFLIISKAPKQTVRPRSANIREIECTITGTTKYQMVIGTIGNDSMSNSCKCSCEQESTPKFHRIIIAVKLNSYFTLRTQRHNTCAINNFIQIPFQPKGWCRGKLTVSSCQSLNDKVIVDRNAIPLGNNGGVSIESGITVKTIGNCPCIIKSCTCGKVNAAPAAAAICICIYAVSCPCSKPTCATLNIPRVIYNSSQNDKPYATATAKFSFP